MMLALAIWQLASGGEASPQAPPRISLAAFKALYDDPARRPLILDVRGPDQYAAGHVPGAQSFPESELDLRVAMLPRDRPIVA
jgi:rhodanese-related sulfurtransferase